MSAIKIVAELGTAVGTLAVAVAAIWGDWLRARWVGPLLTLSLEHPEGERNLVNNVTPVHYYHVHVVNRRKESPAEAVNVRVEGIEKRQVGGIFSPVLLAFPLMLVWPNRQAGDAPTIFSYDDCDLGYLVEGADRFTLAVHGPPYNFQGYVVAHETMRVHIVAQGRTAGSKALVLEVDWDGQWSPNPGDMGNHLVVREVPT